MHILCAAIFLIVLLGVVTSDRRIVSSTLVSKQTHRMYFYHLEQWYARNLEIYCPWSEDELFCIRNPSAEVSGNYDCCIPEESGVYCYRNVLELTDGQPQIEVDLREARNPTKTKKVMKPGADVYLWVFQDQSDLIHCDFDNGDEHTDLQLPSNANIDVFIPSPFGLPHNNFVIYNASQINSGFYKCYGKNNMTNTFELLFGHDIQQNGITLINLHPLPIVIVFVAILLLL
ncbi:hypothetical protein QR680_002332 [Steinernema hermaphroditum]|uniref:Ig-like domain-containing protein n=1 Tax=Steinernema hermaphroditum TaxID=289476 RepID=A0AA39H2A7_9BILA|nr:hypothetical protein QR680_002332 [Steinernema hermaphroditum]